MHKEQVQGQEGGGGGESSSSPSKCLMRGSAPNVSGSTILQAQHKISLEKYSVL